MPSSKSNSRGGGAESLPTSLVLGFYGVMAAAALGWRLAVDGVLPWAEGPDEPVLPLLWRIAAGLAAGAALVAVSRVWTLRTDAGGALADELARLLGPISVGRAWLFALASGLAEEALFRGALQPRVGFLAATLVFAAAHFVPAARLWGWAVFALVAGALFGGLFAATGDLLAPFLAHTLVNGLNLRWLAARERPPPGLRI